MPLFSVIIPAFNSQNFISKAIESVLNQQIKDWELIVVDDGSTDNTYDICKRFSDKNNKIKILHNKNQGVSVARNTGLKHAQGNYIFFIDADDYIEVDTLFSLQKAIVRFNTPDIIIFGLFHNKSSWCPSDNPTNTLLDRKYIETVVLPEQINLCPKTKDIQPYIWNKLFKKSIISEYNILFDEKHRKWNDKEFVLNYLVYSDTMVCLDKPFYHYRDVNTSTNRIGYSFSSDLILSLPERSRKYSTLFEEKYRLSNSKYYKQYMFNITIMLSEEVIKHKDNQTKFVLTTVFTDPIVIDWALSYKARSKEERKFILAVTNGNMNNIDELLENMLKSNENKEKRKQIINSIMRFPKRVFRKIKNF